MAAAAVISSIDNPTAVPGSFPDGLCEVGVYFCVIVKMPDGTKLRMEKHGKINMNAVSMRAVFETEGLNALATLPGYKSMSDALKKDVKRTFKHFFQNTPDASENIESDFALGPVITASPGDVLGEYGFLKGWYQRVV